MVCVYVHETLVLKRVSCITPENHYLESLSASYFHSCVTVASQCGNFVNLKLPYCSLSNSNFQYLAVISLWLCIPLSIANEWRDKSHLYSYKFESSTFRATVDEEFWRTACRSSTKYLPNIVCFPKNSVNKFFNC